MPPTRPGDTAAIGSRTCTLSGVRRQSTSRRSGLSWELSARWVGPGGGFILTPIPLLLYPHDSPKTLTSISLTAVFFNAASGSVAYAPAPDRRPQRARVRHSDAARLDRRRDRRRARRATRLRSRHGRGAGAWCRLASPQVEAGTPGRAPRQPATADRLVSRHLRVPRSARARRHLQRRLRLDLPRDRRGHHPRPLLVRALAFPTHMAPALAFRASDHGRLRSHTSLPAR